LANKPKTQSQIHKSIEGHKEFGLGGGKKLEIITESPDESSRKTILPDFDQT
jgi:hypothetical protein